MKRAFKVIGVIVAVVLVCGLAAGAYLYMTLCTGHAHGMC